MSAFKTFLFKKKYHFATAAVLALGFTTSNTHAGFEWIPQKSAPPKEKAKPIEQRIKAQEPVMVDDMILPLPIEEELSEPVILAPSVPEEKIETNVALPEPEVSKPIAPARIAITPREEPNSGAIVNVEDIPELPKMEKQPMRAQDTESLKVPPVLHERRRIIMPEDAPQSARDTAENSVIISPFPKETMESESVEKAEMPAALENSDLSPAPTPDEIPSEFTEVVGFAKDIPLALALQQVVPADYSFSFAESVNPGTRVSWNGGKSWDNVIADMISPLGYRAKITGKTIRIVQQQASSLNSNTIEKSVQAIEPAAGDVEITEISVLDGTEQKVITPTRPRDVKRINIIDPGIDGEQNADVLSSAANTQTEETLTLREPITKSDSGSVAKNSDVISFWTAEAGASLKNTIEQWSEAANAELVWNAPNDIQLSNEFQVQGSFEKAIELLLKHGVNDSETAYEPSYAASSKNDRIQIIIDGAA